MSSKQPDNGEQLQQNRSEELQKEFNNKKGIFKDDPAMVQELANLELDENASMKDVEGKFKKLSRTHHPDRGGDKAKFQFYNESKTKLAEFHDQHPLNPNSTKKEEQERLAIENGPTPTAQKKPPVVLAKGNEPEKKEEKKEDKQKQKEKDPEVPPHEEETSANMAEKVSSPVIKALGALFAAITDWMGRKQQKEKKDKKNSSENDESTSEQQQSTEPEKKKKPAPLAIENGPNSPTLAEKEKLSPFEQNVKNCPLLLTNEPYSPTKTVEIIHNSKDHPHDATMEITEAAKNKQETPKDAEKTKPKTLTTGEEQGEEQEEDDEYHLSP